VRLKTVRPRVLKTPTLSGVSGGPVDVDAGGGFDLDAAEEGREEELVPIRIVEGEGAVALFEAAEFRGVRGEGRSSIAVGLAIRGAPDRPADKDEIRVAGCEVEVELLVKDGIEAVLLDDLSASLIGRAQSGRAVLARGIRATVTNLALPGLVFRVIDLHVNVRVDASVRGETLGSHELLSRDDIDRKVDVLPLPFDVTSTSLLWDGSDHLDLSKLARLEDVPRLVSTGCKHRIVQLHSQVVGLPVQRNHLNAPTPVLEWDRNWWRRPATRSGYTRIKYRMLCLVTARLSSVVLLFLSKVCSMKEKMWLYVLLSGSSNP
jgi:hypothetical protein